ncbi:MAG TPA: MBL fold metallo-hydrolase [Vicinamibacterales bacterium]|nr:MBL fold metallo-hydrolase [Vicinamibacterales bacterium]
MRRLVVLGAVIVVGGVCVLAASSQQGDGAKTIAVEKLKDNLYVLTTSSPANRATFSGGNVAVFITDAGAVIVDTKLAGWGQALLDGIKKATTKPVTTIINTHTHGDHTGNNELFGATVDSVVQENTKTNMAKMDAFKGDKAKFLPKRTYKDHLTIGSGKDRVELHYFGPGHTNGDTFVVFPALRVLHAGDMFPWKDAPFYDRSNGGTGVSFPQTLSKVLALKDFDTVIPGHSPMMTRSDLQEYQKFTADLLASVRASVKAGKSLEDATASAMSVPAKYKGYQSERLKAGVQAIYEELKK